jgi:hypothetical protein
MADGDAFYALALPFDTDDLEFSRGVEVGFTYAMAQATEEAFDVTMHATNSEMAIRIAEATRRAVRSEELDPGHHIAVSFSAVGEREMPPCV